jgi:hypothetical protein
LGGLLGWLLEKPTFGYAAPLLCATQSTVCVVCLGFICWSQS